MCRQWLLCMSIQVSETKTKLLHGSRKRIRSAPTVLPFLRYHQQLIHFDPILGLRIF